MTIDLHMHSQASDGELSPADLMAYAAGLGVTRIALTDHDTATGVKTARRAAEELGMKFHSGIEVSSIWGKRCIHVVGLNINEDDTSLEDSVKAFSAHRAQRARLIADKLVDAGCPDLYAKVMELAPNKDNVSRLHFARVLMKEGFAQNQQDAFDRYLGEGAPGFVMAPWPAMADAVKMIRAAGGVAVLAHPGRYSFKQEWMLDALVEEFAAAGGVGIEVVSGSQSPKFTPRCVAWAKQFNLAASVGSDFHSHNGMRPQPGQQGEIPEGVPSIVDIIS